MVPERGADAAAKGAKGVGNHDANLDAIEKYPADQEVAAAATLAQVDWTPEIPFKDVRSLLRVPFSGFGWHVVCVAVCTALGGSCPPAARWAVRALAAAAWPGRSAGEVGPTAAQPCVAALPTRWFAGALRGCAAQRAASQPQTLNLVPPPNCLQLNDPRVDPDEDSFFEDNDRSASPMQGASEKEPSDVGLIMDHSMEIESNERMRKENLHGWTLCFIDEEMEDKVSNVRSYSVPISAHWSNFNSFFF